MSEWSSNSDCLETNCIRAFLTNDSKNSDSLILKKDASVSKTN
ncbi:hypothetical protein BC643_0669 [Mangrovibacterium diazotrophicum]|uniref:Uncharacterized protein n=1 Tax=Mangrovibacterium diazotrophicum TaxID=1261403 RepID=A0A419W4G4_9BACT|nr:hypothetical protein BC643_0669 [Mangrovibacterium diazotrophicum]